MIIVHYSLDRIQTSQKFQYQRLAGQISLDINFVATVGNLASTTVEDNALRFKKRDDRYPVGLFSH